MFGAPSDPLAALAVDESVSAALLAAREEIDAVLWRRDVRGEAAAVAAASAERGARDSAAIDGADIVAVDDSPMGRVLAAAFRLNAAVPAQVDVFTASPLQSLAYLHALVAAGFASEEDLGRPRVNQPVDDPLSLGALPPDAALRMTTLAGILTTPTAAPALLVAAIAHGEVAVVRPFTWGSGLVARACMRLVLAGRGVDPSLFTIPERGIQELGRPAYVRALRAYASGTPEGLREFLIWHATVFAMGAKAVVVPS